MRRFALAIAVLASACAAALLLVPRPAPARAEDVLAQMLAEVAPASAEMRGEFCWLEDYGIGIKLTPVPVVSEEFPRLLAGEPAGTSAVSVGLYDCGPRGAQALLDSLAARGAKTQGSMEYNFQPRSSAGEVKGRSTAIQVSPSVSGMLLEFAHAGRTMALLLQTDGASALLGPRRDQLVREMTALSAATEPSVSPLMLDGRYACALAHWQRSGQRLHRKVVGGWLGLRLFAVSLSEFPDLGALQLELEARLDKAGFRRSAGKRPRVAGTEGFLGEYFGGDGFVQRILFAKLEGAYLVALMQGPEVAREDLARESEVLANGIARVDFSPPADAFGAFFGRVRAVRCLAWQDGRRVLWGALFDDGRQQPVTWRQEGIEWQIQLTQGGMVIEDRAGTVASSRDLNPLVDAAARALILRNPLTGDVELLLRVGSEKTTARLTLR